MKLSSDWSNQPIHDDYTNRRFLEVSSVVDWTSRWLLKKSWLLEGKRFISGIISKKACALVIFIVADIWYSGFWLTIKISFTPE